MALVRDSGGASLFISGTSSDSALYWADCALTNGAPPEWFRPPMTFASSVSLEVLA
jgi:hypothetical protein